MPGCIKPMSSPMMKRMLGLLCCWDCCCAQAGMLANENVVNATSRPLETYFDIMWGLPKLPYLPLVAAHEGVLLHDCFCADDGLEFVMHRGAQISGEMGISSRKFPRPNLHYLHRNTHFR